MWADLLSWVGRHNAPQTKTIPETWAGKKSVKLNRYYLRNFRRLEDVEISLEDSDTIFVGPNNSAKTSATAAFRIFVAQSAEPRIYDFSSPLMAIFDAHQLAGSADPNVEFPSMALDLWFTIDPLTEYGRVAKLMSRLSVTDFRTRCADIILRR